MIITAEPVPALGAYLDGEGVKATVVLRAPSRSLGIRVTPTMLLVDGSGRVMRAFVGELSPKDEGAPLNFLRGGQ